MIPGDEESRIHAYGHASGGDGQADDLAEIVQIPVVFWILKIRNDTRWRLQSRAGWTQEGRFQTLRSQHDDGCVGHSSLTMSSAATVGHGGLNTG